MQVLKKVRFRG